MAAICGRSREKETRVGNKWNWKKSGPEQVVRDVERGETHGKEVMLEGKRAYRLRHVMSKSSWTIRRASRKCFWKLVSGRV